MIRTLTSGREAVQQHAWEEAVAAFSEAEAQEPLGPDDALLLAAAAWWSGDVDRAVDAFELAHERFVRDRRPAEAAVVALRLCELAVRRLNFAVGSGWLARAERLLQDEPESAAHAWLHYAHGIIALVNRADFDTALARAERSLQVARAHASADVESLARTLQGQAWLRQGRWAEGLAALDEAAAAAISGGLDLKDACDVYCHTIAACSDLGDYRRAGEWIEQADRWMQRRAIHGYRGLCRVHRAELKRLQGEWLEAEREARSACDELQSYRMLDAIGFAHYEVGEVRLRLGDLPAAEEAFERAYEHGRVPQPGLALLQLAKGEVAQASRAIAHALAADAEESLQARDILGRTRLLPAQVDIALAHDDLPTARAAAEELATIASRYESETLQAAALTARGAVELAEASHEEATATLERAWRAWQRLELPYEGARTRVLLGRARAATGDDATARRELRAAGATFERLGAARDLQEVDALLGGRDAGANEVDRRRLTRTFMFSDIVTSTELVRVIGDDAWKDLIAWHDRSLREAFTAHAGQEVRHTGDGFFVTFERAADAVACALAIQRRLAAHRHEHGFAPRVRIGLHTAEANRHGSDYAGHGVHVAARIGSLAGRDEIVVSAETLSAVDARELPDSEARAVTLDGVEGPVEVHTLRWA